MLIVAWILTYVDSYLISSDDPRKYLRKVGEGGLDFLDSKSCILSMCGDKSVMHGLLTDIKEHGFQD